MSSICPRFHSFLVHSANPKKSSYVWNMIGSMLNAFQSVVFLAVLTRTVGIAEAGIFTIAYADANLFLNIGRFGTRNFQVSDCNHQFTFAQYLRCRYATTVAMVLVSVVYLIFVSSANGYSTHKFLIILLVCLWKVVDSVEDVFHGELQRCGHLDVASKMLTIRIVSMELAWFVILLITRNQLFSVFGGILCSLVCFGGMLFSIRSEFFPDLRLAKAKLSQSADAILPLLKMTFPLFVSMFLAFYIGNAPKYAIDSQLSDALQACYGFIAMPVFVIGLLNNFIFNPIIAKLSGLWAARESRQFVVRSLQQMLIVLLITLVCLGGAYVLGVPVLSWLYHTDLSPYKAELLILIVGGGFLGLSGLLQTLLTIIRLQNVLLWGYVGVALSALLLSAPVVRRFSIRGAALLYVSLMFLLCAIFFFVFLIAVQRLSRQRSLPPNT